MSAPLRPLFHLFFIKLALYVALHALIYVLWRLSYCRCICNIYIYLFGHLILSWNSCPGPFSLLSFPHHSKHTVAIPHAFWSKEGERSYFKTDLFYIFVIKANLFSTCAMSEWNWQTMWGTGGLPLGPALHPSLLLSSLLLPIPSLPRAGPQNSAGEDLARAGHSLAVLV